ncbi:hypothetical protein Y023_5114 [Burkholderia pseudomallei A79D]|nr:hypothetical protein Y023_5114 [Burkholderia pseudomallei A79D]KGX97312.1 hypothetical protein X997_4797 [Burkholderia pseudomallei A79C]
MNRPGNSKAAAHRFDAPHIKSSKNIAPPHGNPLICRIQKKCQAHSHPAFVLSQYRHRPAGAALRHACRPALFACVQFRARLRGEIITLENAHSQCIVILAVTKKFFD